MHETKEFTPAVLDLMRLLGYRTLHIRPAREKGRDGKDRWVTPVQGDGDGFPDILGIKGPVLIAAELKSEKGKTDPGQDAWLDAFRGVKEVRVELWRPSDYLDRRIDEVLRRS